MDKERLPEAALWARALGYDPDGVLEPSVAQVLFDLSVTPEERGLTPIDTVVQNLSNLSAKELTALATGDLRPRVQAALMAQSRLPLAALRRCAERVTRSGHIDMVFSLMEKSFPAQALKMYTSVVEMPPPARSRFVLRRLAQSLTSAIQGSESEEFQAYALFQDRAASHKDDELRLALESWLYAVKSDLDLEALAASLHPSAALEIWAVLLSDWDGELTLAQAQVIGDLLEKVTERPEPLAELLADADTQAIEATDDALRYLLHASDPVLSGLAGCCAMAASPAMMPELVAHLDPAYLYVLVERMAAFPELWPLYTAKVLATSDGASYLLEVFQSVVNGQFRNESMLSPEMLSAMEKMASDLVTADRSAFVASLQTAMYLVDAKTSPDLSWWAKAEFSSDEIRDVLKYSANYRSPDGQKLDLAPGFVEAVMDLPDAFSALRSSPSVSKSFTADVSSTTTLLVGGQVLAALRERVVAALRDDPRAWETFLTILVDGGSSPRQMIEMVTAIHS